MPLVSPCASSRQPGQVHRTICPRRSRLTAAGKIPVMGVEEEKQAAAEAAAELVQNGMLVGLGTGSTVAYLLPALARRGLAVRCVATSPRTEDIARGLGLSVEPFGDIDRFDIA